MRCVVCSLPQVCASVGCSLLSVQRDDSGTWRAASSSGVEPLIMDYERITLEKGRVSKEFTGFVYVANLAEAVLILRRPLQMQACVFVDPDFNTDLNFAGLGSVAIRCIRCKRNPQS
jgi:hypothetical protein